MKRRLGNNPGGISDVGPGMSANPPAKKARVEGEAAAAAAEPAAAAE
jgi:hypothetical protein